MSRQKVKKWPVRRLALFTSLLLCLLVGGVITYKLSTKVDPTTKSGNIDLSPATPEEKQDSEQHKQDIVKDKEQSNDTPPSSKKTVQPVIVNAGLYEDQVEVRSYVPGLFEDGGTCTATFTKGNLSLSRQSFGSKDATTTTCAKIIVNKTDFSETGSWSITVIYTSETAAGSSKPGTIEVE